MYRITEPLGDGQFACTTVHKGIWQFENAKLQVAVKTLTPQAQEKDRVKFLQEAATMGQFAHPNIAKLYGIVTVKLPVCMEQLYLYAIQSCIFS